MLPDPFTVISGNFVNGRPASVHFSLSDTTGVSAIFEFLKSKLVIHHGRDYKVMTNLPVYDQQLAINAYWDLVGGKNMLPGTISTADRYVRAYYNLKVSPKFEDRREALASIFSQMRAVSPPLGMSDPEKPNISSTLYRIVAAMTFVVGGGSSHKRQEACVSPARRRSSCTSWRPQEA